MNSFHQNEKLNLNAYHQVVSSKKTPKKSSINQQIRQVKRLINKQKLSFRDDLLPSLTTQLEELLAKSEKEGKVKDKKERKEFFIEKKYSKIRGIGKIFHLNLSQNFENFRNNFTS